MLDLVDDSAIWKPGEKAAWIGLSELALVGAFQVGVGEVWESSAT